MYESELKAGMRCRRFKDDRSYKVICIARSFNEQTQQWTDFNVVHEPTDGQYCAYVTPLGEFLKEFGVD